MTTKREARLLAENAVLRAQVDAIRRVAALNPDDITIAALTEEDR